jgi:hypothetical protein
MLNYAASFSLMRVSYTTSGIVYSGTFVNSPTLDD